MKAAWKPEVDPTHTKTLRKEYSAACFKRFRGLKGDIRRAVEELDVFNLGQQQTQLEDLSLQELVVLAYSTDWTNNAASPSKAKFQFATDAEKINMFNGWLGNAMQQDILEAPPDSIPGAGHWQGDYVRRSYGGGIKQANRFLKQTPGYEVPPMTDVEFQNVFNIPVHKNKLQALYTRNFSALKKITDDMSGEISRVLTEGLSQGYNPRKMASALNDRVDKIGITRARTMARTETIYAHNEAMLDRYERFGLKEVSAKLEWLTARDGNVCTLCLNASADGPYKIKDARGLIPFHPNCRCTWVPVDHPGAKKPQPPGRPTSPYDDTYEWADDLARDHKDTITSWSRDGYETIRALQKRQFNGDDLGEYAVKRIDKMKDAIEDAPVYNGKLYRGLSGVDDDIARELAEEGSETTFKALSSTSKSKSVAQEFATGRWSDEEGKTNIMLEINAETGRDISGALPGLGGEDEVLMGQGTKYKVASASKDESGLLHIVLDQVVG